MSLPGSYYPLLGYKHPDDDRWFRDNDHYLKVTASEAIKPRPIDAPPILPDKVSSLLERVATDKEKRRRKKSFFKKVGKPKCIPCQKTFNGELQLNQNRTSDKHTRKVNNLSRYKTCQACNIDFVDWIRYKEHINSKKHRKVKIFLQNRNLEN